MLAKAEKHSGVIQSMGLSFRLFFTICIILIEGGNADDCKCGLAKRSTRIVGGSVTEVNEYPWQVAIFWKNYDDVWCGGALISDQWVLTAAHCTDSDREFQVVLGEHDYETTSESDRIRIDVSEIVIHPYWDWKTIDCDFSLLKLSWPVNFSQHPHIRPICLPADDSQSYADLAATTTGWGQMSENGSFSSKLREVTVKVMTNEQCKNTGYNSFRIRITEQMLCAGVENGGKDACKYDSGGPLFTSGSGDGTTPGQNYEHIGVTSWGEGCARPDFPGVYARTTTQLDWISSVTRGSFNTCPRQ